MDFEETFSPVVRYDTIRAIFAIAAVEDFEIRQFDIKTAFLNDQLDEEIYMQVPDGLDAAKKSGKRMVCKLNKALYGLK